MKKRKIYKIAKELNLASDTIISFLQSEMNVDVSKKHLTPVDDQQYLMILKHFDKNAYNSYIENHKEEEFVPAKKEKSTERKIDLKSRAQELEEILNAGELEKKEEKKSSRRIKKIKSENPATEEKLEAESAEIVNDAIEAVAEPEVQKEEKIADPELPKTPALEEEKSEDASKGKKGKKVKVKEKKKLESEEEQDDSDKKGKLKRKKHKKAYGEIDSSTPVTTQKHRKKKKKQPDKEEVNDNVKKTLKQMATETSKSFKKVKKKKHTEEGIEEEVEVSVITATEFISAQELANKMGVQVTEIISKCFAMGLMITINQRLDKEKIELIASEFEFEVEFESEYDEYDIQEEEIDDPDKLVSRPPVVTIMGHVDHGKTSLLDYIRNTRVVAGEAGGITQHIGAYEVMVNEKHITFLDTPGHEAFTAMRARGAKVTDIVVVIIAADDRVMPQTVEAIDHSLAANVPIIFAINKLDKPNSDPEAIKTQLSQRNILVEDWGGKYQCVGISAKTGDGVDDLLDSILLEAEMLELKAVAETKAKATVIESRLDKGLGPVATCLVEKGTLKVGDIFVCGHYNGRVRALKNERMKSINEAGPACPALVQGLTGTPNAGDVLQVVDSESEARDIANKRQQLMRMHTQHKTSILTLDNVSEQIKLGQIKELNIILKGDVDGSIEAVSDSIMKLSNDEVAVRIVLKGVGAINESDVLLAKASGAVILGFSVRPNIKARELASQEKIEIRTYSIIYQLIEEVKQALEGMLSPEVTEEVTGQIEIRATFRVPRIGTIAGCYVLSGKINRNSKVRLIRNDIQVYEGRVSSLKRHKDDAKEVVQGFECGIGIENYNDLKDGDIIEVYEEVETKRTLD